ncbi:hypothetical protein MHOCP_01480 [Moorella humiferrea]|uniref:DUF763 domain-containing protein n=1 Tax=Neomoorella humiferrea TaxID=676965 RepID=UPI0030CF5903
MHTGTASLPLHGGHCPPWLFERMRRLGPAILEIVVREYGAREVLRRLSDPFWFQAFGCVLGFDWHSSGLTTTLCGALKEGLRGRERDLGFVIAGGKGRVSRQTPTEITAAADRLALTALKPAELVYASRMAAKVDNTALQDGYQLYHHVFIFTFDGQWAVVQQGMNERTRLARRYHWLGEGVADFACEPHAAVCCDARGEVLNMVAGEGGESRRVVTELSRERPHKFMAEFNKILEKGLPNLPLPWRHDIPRASYLNKALLKVYAAQPRDFTDLLGVEGVGPKTIRALAMVAEVAYGAPASFRDPVRYSFSHGGKDGHPYPVDRRVYDRSIAVLEQALAAAKIGRTEKLQALKRLASISKNAT